MKSARFPVAGGRSFPETNTLTTAEHLLCKSLFLLRTQACQSTQSFVLLCIAVYQVILVFNSFNKLA
jgi:hypothetical protein